MVLIILFNTAFTSLVTEDLELEVEVFITSGMMEEGRLCIVFFADVWLLFLTYIKTAKDRTDITTLNITRVTAKAGGMFSEFDAVSLLLFSPTE